MQVEKYFIVGIISRTFLYRGRNNFRNFMVTLGPLIQLARIKLLMNSLELFQD